MKNIKTKFKDRVKSFIFNKKFKYNSLITIFAVVFVAVIIVLNLIVSVFVDRYDIKIDLTSSSLYRISDETKDFLSDYDRKVKLILLNDENTFKKGDDIYAKHLYNICKNFAAAGSTISLEFVNLNEQPTFASKYANLGVQQNGILLVDEANNNSKFLPISRLFQNNQNQLGVGEVSVVSCVEKNIANSLEFLSGRNKVKTLVIEGHDELDFKNLKNSVFQDNGYDFVEFNMLTTKMPDDANFIIIAAPNIDYSEDEIKKLEEFINRGKSVVYFASATQPKLPKIEAFLKKNFGVSFKEGVVAETDASRASESSLNNIFMFAEQNNRYIENMPNKKLPINVSDCRPMNVEDVGKGVEYVKICETSPSSVVFEKDDDEASLKDKEKKSFPLAVGFKKNLGEKKVAKVTVFSSTYILGALEVPQLGNGEFILNVFGETVDNKSKIKVLPKVIETPRLAISKQQAGLLGSMFILIVPISVVVVGILIYYKRKRR